MKGVIPAAGLGTRMLPATKSQPKEMLPVARKPVIQYIVEEMEQADIKDVLIITGKNKRAIDDHFDREPILLEDLRRRNKHKEVQYLEELESLNVQIFYVRQAVPTGLADAVYMAKDFIGEDEFVVALGDTIIDSLHTLNHLKRLINFHHETGAICSLSTERIPKEHCNRYGILSVRKYSSPITTNTLGQFLVNDLVEKPSFEEAPSDLAICGRYVFHPIIFDFIEQISLGVGGEKQLTDAIKMSLSAGTIAALQLSPTEIRYDTGTFPLYAKAFIAMCLKDQEIGEEIKEYLASLGLAKDSSTINCPLQEISY